MAKRQRKGKAHKNGTKANPNEKKWVLEVKQTHPLLGHSNLHRAGSRWGGDKCIKGGSQDRLRPLGSACPHASRVYFPLLGK